MVNDGTREAWPWNVYSLRRSMQHAMWTSEKALARCYHAAQHRIELTDMAVEGSETFGALLRRHRVCAGLTQAALAERAGLSLRGLSDLERGARRAPFPETVRRLAEAIALSETERIALLTAGRRTTPAPSTPSAQAHLPAPVSSFVGRTQELGEVRTLLGTTRLLTLTGTGGVGKTRLAIEAARTVQTEFADGVWLIELEPLADSRLVPQVVAAVLGVREQPGAGHSW